MPSCTKKNSMSCQQEVSNSIHYSCNYMRVHWCWNSTQREHFHTDDWTFWNYNNSVLPNKHKPTKLLWKCWYVNSRTYRFFSFLELLWTFVKQVTTRNLLRTWTIQNKCVYSYIDHAALTSHGTIILEPEVIMKRLHYNLQA